MQDHTMQDYELEAWLGDVEVTPDQWELLHRAADDTAARYKNDDGDAAEQAFTAAAMVILGDSNVDAAVTSYAAAKRAERAAMETLTGAIIGAVLTGDTEKGISDRTGINRGTVRKALGK